MPLTPETLGLIESTVYLCLMTEKTISVSALFCKMQEFESLIQNRKNIFFVASCQNEKPVNADKYGIHGLFVFYFCGMNYAQITEKKTVLIAKMQVRIPIEIIDLFDGNLRTGF